MFRSPHHREFWSHTNRRISWITLGLVVLSSADAFAWWWLYKQTGFATKWWSQCLENQPWLGQKWLENAWKRLNHPIWDLPMKGMKKMIMMGFTTVLPNLDGFNHLQVEWEWLMIGFATSEPWNHFSLQIPDRARVPELSSCKSHSSSG